MRILFAYRQRTAVCYYRSILPARALEARGHTVGLVDYHKGLQGTDFRMSERWVQSLANKWDLIVVDRAYDDHRHLGFLAGIRHVNPGSRMVVDFDDDFTNVPAWNESYSAYQPGQLSRRIGESHLKLAEMVTVPTQRLAEVFKDKCHAIRVAPNCIDPKEFANKVVAPDRGGDANLRILYGGAGGHYGDLDEVRPGLEAVLRKEDLRVRLVCIGAAPFWMHEAHRAKPGRMVLVPYVDDFFWYPSVVGWGGFDLAIAPLADHPFNYAKSNIKVLEAAVQGIPMLASDVGPYAAVPDECIFKAQNTSVQWAESLLAILADRDLRRKKAEAARYWVDREHSLDRLGDVWQTIADEAMSRPRIETTEDTRLPSDPRPVPPA